MKPHILQRNNLLTVPSGVVSANGWTPRQVHFEAVDLSGGVAFIETNEQGIVKDMHLYRILRQLGAQRRIERGEGAGDAEAD